MPKKRCKHCREYRDRDEMVVKGLSAFCSEEHFIKWRSEGQAQKKKIGAARATTQRRAKAHSDGVSEALRERVFRSDGYRCRFCGGRGENLAIHHVIYRGDKSNLRWQDQPSNLITLHNFPCHLDHVHGNKDLYLPLCLQLVWLRETTGDKHTTIQILERRMNAR